MSHASPKYQAKHVCNTREGNLFANYELKARMKEWRKTENTRGDTKGKITGERLKGKEGGWDRKC